MDPIKVEFQFTPEALSLLKDVVRETVEKVLKENIAAIKAENTALTRKEAAKRLTIGLNSLDELLGAGELNSRKVGKRILIPESEIKRYLKQSA